ncbi:MAG: hypothetical protein K0S34_912 [Bacillales bacterium]|jgi:hypothetical protein|nr:hypothetical protein [Bacillales bacterium]
MYILPLGFSKKGKKIIILVSAMLAIIGLLASNILTLTTAFVVLLITSIIFTVLLEKNFGESLLVNEPISENILVEQVTSNDVTFQNNNVTKNNLDSDRFDNENLESTQSTQTDVLVEDKSSDNIENEINEQKFNNNISRFELLIANIQGDKETQEILQQDVNEIEQLQELESLDKIAENKHGTLRDENVSVLGQVDQSEIVKEEINNDENLETLEEAMEQVEHLETLQEDEPIEEVHPELIQKEAMEQIEQLETLQEDEPNEEVYPELILEDKVDQVEHLEEIVLEEDILLKGSEITEEMALPNKSEIQANVRNSFSYQIVETLIQQLEHELTVTEPKVFRSSIDKLLLCAVDIKQRFTLQYILAKNLLVFKETKELFILIQQLKDVYSNYPMLLLNLNLFTNNENNLLDKVEKYEEE